MSYDVVILPSFNQVEWRKKRKADACPMGSFAQVSTTFDAWIADLWELHGDGRLLIDSMQREVFMWSVAREAAVAFGRDLTGVAAVASECVRLAAGVDELERAIAAVREGHPPSLLSEYERDFLMIVGLYEEKIAARGLVELGEAAHELAEDSSRVFPRQLHVLVDEALPLTWIQRQFFDRCEALAVDVRLAEGAGGVGKVPDGIEVRFAFPSGRLAQPGLVADCIDELADAGSIVVTCEDPLELFSKLERRFDGGDRCLKVQASKPFAQTDFGKAFIACNRVVRSAVLDRASLSDAVGGFFSGFSRTDAMRIDDFLRSDRTARKEDVLPQLREKSELFSQLENSSSDVDAAMRIDAFERHVQVASHRSGAWRAEQLSALALVRSVAEGARLAGVGIDACVDVLSKSEVPVAAQVGDSASDVLVTSRAIAARLPGAGCDAVVLADLTAEDYPVAEKDEAITLLLSSLGLKAPESELARSRREFRALLELPTRRIVFVRPLGDENADETYPAVLLEELVDSYRPDPSDASDLRNIYRLPEFLQSGLSERGEELLYANSHAGARDAVQPIAEEILEPRIDDLKPGGESRVISRRCDGNGKVVENACPPPSGIEAFLECPYRWFATRRLHIGLLDEEFGPRETGSFAHAALEAFYRRFQEAGYKKVNSQNIVQAREVMCAVVAEKAESQYAARPRSGRLVAVNELERREVSSLCERLVDYLDFEALLLPTFHPAYLEYEIDAGHAVDYAGYSLVGKVDRIDVDDAGHAAIIDYKESVSAEHDIGGKTREHPGKVQTRIYAQAVKRSLGLDVVAALYVSYGRKRAISGAFDPTFIEAAHVPCARVEQCACGFLDAPPDVPPEGYSLASLAFGAMLDETESIAGHAISSMEAGVIAPRPAYPRVCDYCPVLSCPKRGE